MKPSSSFVSSHNSKSEDRLLYIVLYVIRHVALAAIIVSIESQVKSSQSIILVSKLLTVLCYQTVNNAT